ncbi:MAG: citrate transporter, partial [Clostridia bacterium]|nr:citrate transporter [Clostridia bacterium]
IREFVSGLLERNTLITSVLSCQFISNVPSAILLSQFTENYRALLIGVNIGGVGTLIASLASLITFREFTKNYPARTKSYILLFLVINFAFLAVLTVIMSLYLAK